MTTLMMLRKQRKSTRIETWVDSVSILSGKTERKEMVVRGTSKELKESRILLVSTVVRRATTLEIAKAGEDQDLGIEIGGEGVVQETVGIEDQGLGVEIGIVADLMIDMDQGQIAALLEKEEMIEIAEIEETVMIEDMEDTEKMIEGTIVIGEIEITDGIGTIGGMTEEMIEGMIGDAIKEMIKEKVDLSIEMVIAEEEMIVDHIQTVNHPKVEITIAKKKESKFQLKEGQKEGLIESLRDLLKGDKEVFIATTTETIDRKMMVSKIQWITEIISLWKDNPTSNHYQRMEINILKRTINKTITQRIRHQEMKSKSKEMIRCLSQVMSVIEFN